jgi:hypothetical protein
VAFTILQITQWPADDLTCEDHSGVSFQDSRENVRKRGAARVVDRGLPCHDIVSRASERFLQFYVRDNNRSLAAFLISSKVFPGKSSSEERKLCYESFETVVHLHAHAVFPSCFHRILRSPCRSDHQSINTL